MDSSASSRAGWLRLGLNALFVVVLVVGAFFGGWGIAQRRTEKAVRDARETAEVARRQEEEVRLELQLELAKWPPPPPVPDEALPGKLDGQGTVPLP